MGRTKSYVVGQSEPFKISRSKMEEHHRCPRCSVLTLKHGLKRQSMVPFNLNIAVDTLLKNEFDQYREAATVHPLVADAGLDLVPFAHPDIDIWRDTRNGIKTVARGFEIMGAVDDVWIDREGNLVIVDYKATGKSTPVTEVGRTGFGLSYRRQLEIYQWLFRQNGFSVSDTAYWVYATATAQEPSFDSVLRFVTNLIEFQGSATWIESELDAMKADLDAFALPEPGAECDVCRYYDDRMEVESRILFGSAD